MIIREPDNFYAALEGWEPILSKEGKVMGYKTKPLVESVIQVLHGSPELVHQGPQPEAHKSIHDYRDQLAAKRRRKRHGL